MRKGKRMITWQQIITGESEKIEDLPEDATIISIDDRTVINKCECGGYLLDIDGTSCECNKCETKHHLIDDLM